MWSDNGNDSDGEAEGDRVAASEDDADRKYIISSQQVAKLFARCRKCGSAVTEVKKREQGSMLVNETCA